MTNGDAARAVAVAAVLARDVALIAEDGIAALAVVPIILVDRAAAVLARLAIPMVQLDVSAALGVGEKRLRHDREEVQEPPLGKRRANGSPALALAKRVVLGMGRSSMPCSYTT